MTQQIAERDWKIAKTLHEIAMARAFERAVAEISRLISDESEAPQERFWNVHKFVMQQKTENADTFDRFLRSSAIIQLGKMRARGLLTDSETSRLSPVSRERLVLFQQLREGK